MKKQILFGTILMIFLLVGCSQQTKYVCPDGSTVSDASKCGDCICHTDCEEGKFCSGGKCTDIITNEGCAGNINCGNGEFCNDDWKCEHYITDDSC